MNILSNRRLGRFSISLEIIDDSPEVVQGILGSGIVIGAEVNMATGTIEYLMLNDDFEEVPDAQEAPVYDLKVEEREDGYNIEWVKFDGQ